jgi:hypothetical protein
VRENKLKYNLVNIVIILVTAALFIFDYREVSVIFQNTNFFRILILIVTVMLVHSVKAVRLYLALYGADISFLTYLKIYCKVAPVSIIFPCKTGEFFRMYCYGKQLKNILKGIVIVLLDRFMDTVALVTMILVVLIFNGGHLSSFVYMLLIFLVFALLLYLLFPDVFQFWKKYILRAKATENKLAILRFLDKLNLIYKEITNVSKGRGIILYFLSLIAWAVEIGSITILNGLFREGQLNQTISDYLMSAMSGRSQSTELKQFVFASVILMVVIYIIIKFIETIMGKR